MTHAIPAAPKDHYYQRGRGTGAGSASDQQIRLVLRYGGLLDLALLRRAVRAVVEADPILRARFVEPRPWEGRWELRHDQGAEGAAPEVELAEVPAADAEAAIAAFLADLAVRPDGPYFRPRVIRAAGRDALCLRVDHRLCDGAGAKLLAYRLSEAYRRLGQGEPLPQAGHTGDELLPRTAAGLTHREPPPPPPPPPEPPGAPEPWRPLSFALPRAGYANERPAHAVRVVDAAAVSAVRRAGKAVGATLTDAILTALVRALRPHLVTAADEPLALMVSSDYRSRLPPGTPEVLCNLFQGFFPDVRAGDPARPFRAALSETAAAMGRWRAGFTLEEALRAESAFVRTYRQYADLGEHPRSPAELPGTFVILSNVGVLDEARLEPGAPPAPPVVDAQLLGTVALGRELLLCTSSFRGALTLSFGYCRSDLPPSAVEGILDRVAAELSAFAREG